MRGEWGGGEGGLFIICLCNFFSFRFFYLVLLFFGFTFI